MSDDHIYDVELKWDQERKGTLSSDAFETNLEVATPPDFPKGMEGYWSPEHLYIASVSSCLMTTFLAIAEQSKLNFEFLNVHARGRIEKVDGAYCISVINLVPHLRVSDEKDIEKGQRLLEKAENACLISNSIKTKIEFETEVESA